MEYLFERFGIIDDKEIHDIARAINAFRPTHLSFSENSPIQLWGDIDNPNEYDFGLNVLEKNGVITYIKSLRPSTELIYIISIINRYNLELLTKELVVLEIEPDRLKVKRDISLIRMPDVVYYDPHSGKIIINGKINVLRGSNKHIFDGLYAAYPNRADRKTLLEIIDHSSKDKLNKVAINEVFSNLKSACGVSAKVITLNNEGGKLIADTYPLSAQLGRSNS